MAMEVLVLQIICLDMQEQYHFRENSFSSEAYQVLFDLLT